jgi:hypothetical protein
VNPGSKCRKHRDRDEGGRTGRAGNTADFDQAVQAVRFAVVEFDLPSIPLTSELQTHEPQLSIQGDASGLVLAREEYWRIMPA